MTAPPLPKPSEAARLAKDAYAGPWRWQSAGHVRATDRELGGYRFVTFEGTTLDGLAIVRDIRFLPWADAGGIGPIGAIKGVQSVAEPMIFDLADDLKPSAEFPHGRVAFNGHSLGAALALRLAALFAALGHPPAAVYALEPYRCLWLKGRRLLRRVPFVFACADGNDPVPGVEWPYLLWPYRLPERMARIGSRGVDPLYRHRIDTVIADLEAAGL